MPMDAKFVLGLAEMDSQHEYFFALLDQVEAVCARHKEAGIPLLMSELLRYTEFHFASEEALMTAYGYPGDEHKAEHVKLLDQARAFPTDKVYRPSSLRLFLYNWIVNHIELEDQKLAAFVLKARAGVADSIRGLLDRA